MSDEWGEDEFAESADGADRKDALADSKPGDPSPRAKVKPRTQTTGFDFSEFSESWDPAEGRGGSGQGDAPELSSEAQPPAAAEAEWGDAEFAETAPPAEQAPQSSPATGNEFTDFSETAESWGAGETPAALSDEFAAEPAAAEPGIDFGEFSEPADGVLSPSSATQPTEWGESDFVTRPPADEPVELEEVPLEEVPLQEAPVALDAEAAEEPPEQEIEDEWGEESFLEPPAARSVPVAEEEPIGPAESEAATGVDAEQPAPVEDWDEAWSHDEAAETSPPDEAVPSGETTDDDWGDVEASVAPVEEPQERATTARVPSDLPLSIGSYVAHLESRVRADSKAAARAAQEREKRAQERPAFQHTGDKAVDAQLELLYRELEGRTGAPDRALFLRRVAEVYAAKALEVKLQAAGRLRGFAKEALQQAGELAGQSLPIARELRRLHELDEDWSEALSQARIEEAAASRAGVQQARIEALLAQGRAHERMGNDEQAIRNYQQVLALDANNLAALQGLDAALARRAEWEPLINVLERQAALVHGAEEQAQILYRLGQVLSRFLAQQPVEETPSVATQVFINKVIDCFRGASAKSANPVPALAALRQIYARFGRWAEFIVTSDTLAERTEQKAAKVYLLYHNGRVQLDRFDNADEALNYFERILEIDPSNILTLKALEKIHTERGDDKGLLSALQRQATVVTDPGQQVLINVRVARLFDEAFGETTQSIEWYSKALEIDPHNRYALAALGKLHARNKDWEKLAQIYAYEADAAEDIKQRVDFLIKGAEIRVNHFDDVDGAIDILFNALSQDDANLAIYRELGRLLAQRKRWMDLIRLHEAEITLTQDKDRLVALHMSLGELWQEDFDAGEGIDKSAKAVEAYYRALEIDASHTPALRSLGRLFAVWRDWARLSEVFALEVELAPTDGTKADIYIRMAELEEERSKDLERAVFFLRKALELQPHNKMVLAGLARLTPRLQHWDDLLQAYVRDAETSTDSAYSAALHQLIGHLWQDQFQFPAKAHESFRKAATLQQGNIVALRSLEEAFEAEGRWQDLLQVLEDDLTATEERDQKVVLLKRLAEVSESQLGNRTAAARYYERILEIAPDNFDALEHAARLWRELGDFERQAAALEGLLRVAQDPDYLAQVHLEFARLLGERRPIENSTTKAIESLEVVLSRKPESREALDLLTRLLHEQERWDELAPALRKQVVLDTDDAARAAHYRWLGRALIEGTAPGEEAIEALGHALELDSTDLSSRLELVRACEKAGRYEEAAEHLRKVQGELQDVERRRALAVDLARLYHDHLGRSSEAQEILRGVLSEEIDHPGATQYLAKIAEDRQDWDEAISIVERRYALASDDRARVPHLRELARLWDERKEDLARAAECCSKILEQRPNDLDAVTHLGEIETRRDRPAAYCPLGEKEIALLEARGVRENSERLHLLHHRLATGYRDQLDERKRAREHLRAALDLKPSDFDAMKALEALYEADMMWEELADQFSYRADKTSDDGEKLALFVQAARTWRDRSQATEAAQQALGEYQKALLVNPNETTVLSELAELAEKSGEFGLAAKTLEHLADVVPEKQRPPFMARAGRLFETCLDESQRAVDIYGEVLEIDANYVPALEPLVELLYRQQNWRQALPLYERLSRLAFGGYSPDEQARFHYQHGVVLENLGQDEQAIRNYRAATAIRPHYLDPINALVALYERRRNWPEFAAVLEQKAASLESLGRQDELFEVYARLGEAQESLKQPQKALEWYRRAVERNPSFVEGLAAAGRLARELGEIEAAAKSYERAAGAAVETGEREAGGEYYFLRGEILFTQLSNAADAVVAYERALEAFPDHPEALDRLARARYQSGDLPGAREAFERLAQRGAEGTLLADYYNHLGRIALEHEGDEKAAISRFERALTADAKHRPTFESLGELYEKTEQWSQAAGTYEKFIQLVQGTAPQQAAPLHEKLGDLYKDRLNKPEQAMVEYRKASRLDPRKSRPHVQLAAIFATNPATYGEEVKEHAALLALEPFREESYHRLFSIYEEQQAHDKAFCVASALTVMGKAKEAERLYYEAQVPRNPPTPRGNFEDASAIGKMLWHPFCQHGAAEMMQVAGFALGRLTPSSLEQLGVGRGDKVAPEDANAVNQVLRRTLAFMVEPPCDVYWCRKDSRKVRVLATPKNPTVLLGPDALSGLHEQAERAFVIGRSVWPLADGSFPLLAFEAGQIPRVLALIGRVYDDEFKVGGDPEQAKREAKLIAKEISRKAKKDGEPLLGRFREALAKLRPDRWLRGIDLTSDRFGLLLCNDLRTALALTLKRKKGFEEFGPEDITNWQESFGDFEPVRELLRFAVSEEYFSLRQRLRASILSV